MNDWESRATIAIKQQGKSTHELWWLMARFGLYAYVIIVLGLAYLVTDKMRLADIVIPVFVAIVITLVIQQVIRRPRPEHARTTYDLWIHTFSFPSAHASTSFAAASSLSFVFLASSLSFAWVYVILFFLLAILIAISRIMVGVHHLFDVIAGSALGMLISIILLSIG
jgi:undecaprenyl-diphosphatase